MLVYNKLLTLRGTVFSFCSRYQKRRIMITYLLLRSNKESGPFSLEELRQIELKPYDLIWVSGKSAAWRYPGEIEELKEFAPAVEEQPYDRFFKKPSETKPQPEVSYQPKTESYQPKTTEPATPAPETHYTPAKSVFVTMPGQKSFTPKPETKEPPVKKPEPIPIEQTISIKENPVAAEIKYSQPLDEIKEMYVKTLHDRRQRIANRTFLVQSLKKVAVVLAIVGIGVVIGLVIKSNGGNKQQIAGTSLTNPVQSQQQKPSAAKPADPDSSPLTDQQEETSPQTLSNEKSSAEPLFSEPERPEPEKPEVQKQEKVVDKTVSIPKTRNQKREVSNDEVSPGVEMNTQTGERYRKTRNESAFYDEESEKSAPARPEPKAVMKSKDLTKEVFVKSNEYQRVAFGGIRNLQLTVYNDSKYLLDNVTVELQYLKPSEEPLRIDLIQFKNVAPGGTMTVRMPDTNRGIKVLYKITHILSVQSAKETAGL